MSDPEARARPRSSGYLRGILIKTPGAIFSKPSERSGRMLMVMIERDVQQLLELDGEETMQ